MANRISRLNYTFANSFSVSKSHFTELNLIKKLAPPREASINICKTNAISESSTSQKILRNYPGPPKKKRKIEADFAKGTTLLPSGESWHKMV